MTERHSLDRVDIVEYQRSLCSEEELLALDHSRHPSPARFHAVACGTSDWTIDELEVINADPQIQEYEARMRAAVELAVRAPVSIPLQRVANDNEGRPDLRAAARPANDSSDTVHFVGHDGHELFLLPADANGHVTVRIVGTLPRGTSRLARRRYTRDFHQGDGSIRLCGRPR